MSGQGGVVLDASAAVTWVLRDADPADEARIDDVMCSGFVLVPELWHAEVANAFCTALRDKRVDEAFVMGVCEQLGNLDVRTDRVGVPIQRLTMSAHQHSLTAYDAMYLLLAQDRGLPLATLDRALARAAREVQVELML